MILYRLWPEKCPCRNIPAYSPEVKGDKPTGGFTRQVYWRCKYHRVWTPAYRFSSLKDKPGKERDRAIYILCGINECEVLALNAQSGHVHHVVIVPPKIALSTLTGHLKGHSTASLWNRFPHLRNKL